MASRSTSLPPSSSDIIHSMAGVESKTPLDTGALSGKFAQNELLEQEPTLRSSHRADLEMNSQRPHHKSQETKTTRVLSTNGVSSNKAGPVNAGGSANYTANVSKKKQKKNDSGKEKRTTSGRSSAIHVLDSPTPRASSPPGTGQDNPTPHSDGRKLDVWSKGKHYSASPHGKQELFYSVQNRVAEDSHSSPGPSPISRPEDDGQGWDIVSRSRKRRPASATSRSNGNKQVESRGPASKRSDSDGKGQMASKVLGNSQTQHVAGCLPTSYRPLTMNEIDFPSLPSSITVRRAITNQGKKSIANTENSKEANVEPITVARKISIDSKVASMKQERFGSFQMEYCETSDTSHQTPPVSEKEYIPDDSAPAATGKIYFESGVRTGHNELTGPFWQPESYGFPCAKAGCDNRCDPHGDDASVICPSCGPFSETRYCSAEHLYKDIKWHWPLCCQMPLHQPWAKETIPEHQKEGPPLLLNLHNWDSPERHRQAVYHATNRSGDYFIFADWLECQVYGQPPFGLSNRCSNRIMSVVKFDNPEKDRFRRVLGVCLFAAPEVFGLINYLFRLIRDNLRSKGKWTESLDMALRFQMQLELGVHPPPTATGLRHACETEWEGRNRRHCNDPVCLTDYPPLLGMMGMGGNFRHLCDYMESSYWLLRAARITHPTVTQIAARTRGEGFQDIHPKDQRLFRRGEMWDGVGSGEIETEGFNA